MFICEICEREFLNSDEFNAHQQKHLADTVKPFSDLLKMSPVDYCQTLEKATNELATILAEKMSSILLPTERIQAVPVKRDHMFEAIQLTIIALSAGKSVSEVLEVYKEFCEFFLKQDSLVETKPMPGELIF